MNLMSDIVKIVEKHKKYSQVSQITLYMQNALPVQYSTAGSFSKRSRNYPPLIAF